jgi:hypothetical protein
MSSEVYCVSLHGTQDRCPRIGVTRPLMLSQGTPFTPGTIALTLLGDPALVLAARGKVKGPRGLSWFS